MGTRLRSSYHPDKRSKPGVGIVEFGWNLGMVWQRQRLDLLFITQGARGLDIQHYNAPEIPEICVLYSLRPFRVRDSGPLSEAREKQS